VVLEGAAALSMREGVEVVVSAGGGAVAVTASGAEVGWMMGTALEPWFWICPSPISPTICALVRARRARARMVLVESNIMMGLRKRWDALVDCTLSVEISARRIRSGWVMVVMKRERECG